MTRVSLAGLVVALLAAMPPVDLLAGDGQRGRGPGGSAVDSPSRYVIVGHVGDQAKRPVADAFVTALLPSRTPNQPFALVSARLRTTTDAHGNFRLEGLYPADFYVVVLPAQPAAGQERAAESRRVREHVLSERVEHDGREARARQHRRHGGSGNHGAVRSSFDGVGRRQQLERAAGARRHPESRARGSSVRARLTSARDRCNGCVHRAGPPAGDVFLQYHESQWPPPRGETPTVSQAKVVVRDADVANVRVNPIKLVIATGHVVVSAEDRDELLARPVEIGTTPVNLDGNPGPDRPGLVREDLSFDLGAWPGPHLIRLQGSRRTGSSRAVRVRGVTMPNQTVDFTAGRAVIGLEVEIGRRRRALKAALKRSLGNWIIGLFRVSLGNSGHC